MDLKAMEMEEQWQARELVQILVAFFESSRCVTFFD
jgi:hypothetical protein